MRIIFLGIVWEGRVYLLGSKRNILVPVDSSMRSKRDSCIYRCLSVGEGLQSLMRW